MGLQRSKPSNRTPEVPLSGLVLSVHVLFALAHGGPVAVPDVPAYLSVSQWVYGGQLPDNLPYHPGFGILLMPFGWLSGSMLHTVALILNGLLAALCVILAARFARSLGASQWVVTAVAVIAALHPSLSTSSRIAWPETLLTALVLGLGMLLQQRKWLIAGVVSGLSFVIHPRAVVLILAAAAIAVVQRRWRTFATGCVPAFLMALLLVHICDAWPSARIDAAQNIANNAGKLAATSGQLLSLAGTTAGLGVFGVVVGLIGLRRQLGSPGEGFLAISAVGMLLLGGWVLAGSIRTDTVMYGRYMGPWVVALSTVGITAISKRLVNVTVAVAALAPICIAGLCVLASASTVETAPRHIMTLGLTPLWSLSGGALESTVVCAAGIAITGIVVATRSWILPAALLLGLAAPALVMNHQHLHGVGQIAKGQVRSAELVPDDVLCLAHDSSVKGYALWLYRLELPKIKHERIDLSSGGIPCGSYIIARSQVLEDCEAAELIRKEPRAAWGLWVYPRDRCV